MAKKVGVKEKGNGKPMIENKPVSEAKPVAEAKPGPDRAEAIKVLQQEQQASLERAKAIMQKAYRDVAAEGWVVGAEPYYDRGLTKAEVVLIPKKT